MPVVEGKAAPAFTLSDTDGNKVALKELRETNIWLKIIERKPLCPPERLESILQECDELIAIFVKSIKTAQDNES